MIYHSVRQCWCCRDASVLSNMCMAPSLAGAPSKQKHLLLPLCSTAVTDGCFQYACVSDLAEDAPALMLV